MYDEDIFIYSRQILYVTSANAYFVGFSFKISAAIFWCPPPKVIFYKYNPNFRAFFLSIIWAQFVTFGAIGSLS